jgi:hypothetical protein
MAKLLTGTRIYGTGTVDTQLLVNGTEQATSTATGALEVVGGVGIGGSLFVGGIVTATNLVRLTNATEASTTNTGALTVAGGVGVGKDLRVGGTIYGTIVGTVVGTITTASNLGSGTIGQVPFQEAPGVTKFFGPGTDGQLLVSAGASSTGPVYTNTASIYVGRAALADDLSGGAVGSIPYQDAANSTVFLGLGTPGFVMLAGATAPVWVSTSTLSVGRANQSDSILMANEVADTNVNFITFASTTTGYTTLKGGAMSNLTYKPSTGFVGVGAGSPAYRLHVVESGNAVPVFLERSTSGDILQLYNQSGLTASESSLGFVHKDSATTPVSGSRIAGYASNLATGAVSGGIIFYSKNAGTEAESFRVNNLGNVGLGNNAPAYKLDITGGVRMTGITTSTNATASTSPTTGALQLAGGAGVQGNVNASGQFVSTQANNTATGSAQLYLNGVTGNRIDFNINGVAAPSVTPRSVGTKIVYYPGLSSTSVDYATGIETGALWTSVPNATDTFRWYGSTTLMASLSNSNLTLGGDLAVNGGDITSNATTFSIVNTTATTVNIAGAGTAITIGSNSAGTTTIRNVVAITTNTVSSAYTNGALVVTGGVGIAGDLRVNGTIFGSVSVSGITSTATNIAGGTAGQIPYQTGPGVTAYFGPGTAGDVLVSNGTSAPTYNNTLALAGTTAATNATSGALRVAGGVGINDNLFVTNNINAVSGQYVSTRANNTATGAGQILLNGASGNRIDFNQNGVAAPTFTTRSAGTKLVLYSDLSASSTDYALGIESGTLWSSVSTTARSFKWYGGTTLAATLSGTGNLTLVGDAAINGGDITTTQTTFNLVDATATTVNFAGAATALTMGAVSGTTTVRNNLTVAGNLTVQGTTTQVNSTVTNVSDPIFTLGTGPLGADPTADDNRDRGIAFKWHNGTNARTGFFGFDDSTGYFTFVSSATITNEVIAPAGGTTRGAIDANLAGGATGSLPYQSAANVSAFLPIGTAGQILGVSAGLPAWVASSSITVGTASQISMTNDNASTTPQFITFVSTSTGAATLKADAMEGLTFIPSSNFLGIGQGTPAYPLHINVPTGLASIGMSGTAANATTYKVMQGTTGVSNGGFSLYDVTNSATRFMIGSTGNVGIGTGTQDPTDRLHISNSGGTATLRVGDSAGIAAGIIVQRTNSGISSLAHYFLSSANSPWQHWGENLTWTGERAGTVNSTHAHRPYYEAYAPVVGYREFGFVNLTSGAFTSSNLVSNLTLKNDATTGINTTSPTRALHVVSTSWDNVTGAGAIFENNNSVGSGITLKPSASVVTNGSSGWAIYAGAAGAAIGDGNLGFWAHGDNQARMMITRAGSVGIGEASPGSYGRLAVRISSNTGVGAGGSSAIWLQNANGSNNNAATIFFGDNAAAAMGAINFVHADYANDYGEITFDTRGAGGYSEKVRITQAGRVGIATNAPNATLDVAGTVFISGITTVTNTTVTTSETSGAFQVRGGVGINGALFVGGLYTSPTQSLALTLGTESWVKLCTLVNRCAAKIQIGAGSNNSEEEAEIEIFGTYNLAGTQINVKRQTYNEHLREVRVTQATAGGPKIVYVRLRTTEFAPTINWRLFSSKGVTSLDNVVETPTTGESVIVDQANGYFTNVIAEFKNTTQATSTNTGALQVAGGAGIGGNLYVGANLVVSGTLTAGSVSGTTTTATNATNSIITNDNATATDQYVTFVNASSGANPIKVSATTGLIWKPNTVALGIGVSPSLGKLHVSGKGYFSTEVQANSAIMNSASVNGTNSAVFGSNSGAVPILITRNADPVGTDLYINGSGDVSIGSYSLSSKFGVSGPATATTVNSQSMVARLASSTGNQDYLEFSNVRGTAGSNWTTAGFRIQQKVDSTWMGYMQFNGTPSGTNDGGIIFGTGTTTVNANSIAERMRISGAGNVSIGTTASTTRLTVQAAGANGIALLQDTGAAANSGRLFFQASGGTYGILNTANVLQFSSGATIGSDSGTSRMVLNASGFLGLGTTQVPLTYLDIRHNNTGVQSPQVSGFTLRTNENNGMEWHLQHSNGYQGWVAAARVNNNGSSFGQGFLEFITAGSSGGNQVSVMALHGNGNVSIGSTAVPAYKLFVNGSFAATTKSFVIDHPTKEGYKLRYASLEGPENGVYVRGRLKDNNVIELPEHWLGLVDADSITVDITPIGKHQVLYVDDIANNRVIIGTESDQPVNCFYTVWGERKDVDKLVVEYEE